MALPTIPTSFVPHPTATTRRSGGGELSGLFDMLSYLVFLIVFVMAVGVFVYGRMVSATQASKDAELAKAEAAIDPVTVEGFVRLQNRLNAGGTLLKNHIAVSNFFTALSNITPASVRFASLHISTSDVNKVAVDGTGVARNFNALAAASIAFAGDGRIKDVIFSNISVNENGSVSFGISATLDPKIITYSP